MSDPVTNVEIEDVLASIRKLISRHDPAAEPSPRPDGPAATPSRPRPAADRLVLTPALRVPDDAPSDSAEPSDPAVDEVRPAAPVTPDREPDEPAAAQAAPAADPVPGFPILKALTEGILETPSPQLAAPRAAEPKATEPHPTEPQASEPRRDRPASAAPLSASRSSLLATIAELEAAVGRTPQEFEPDGSETHPQVDWSAIEGPPRAAGTTGPAPSAPDPDEPEPRLPRQDAPESRRPAPDERAAAAEVTAAVSAAERGQPAGAAPASRPQRGTVEPLRLGEIARAVPPATPTPTPAAPPAPPAGRASDPGTELAEFSQEIDEEALRDLVAEIVREELQGALGERITRNVRKLVRREIYRVLSSQDFN